MKIRDLDDEDVAYALSAWRESHKQSPGCDRVPWGYYKHAWGALISRVLEDDDTVKLGAYNDEDELLGFIVYTPSKRVDVLHWIHVKYKIGDAPVRRQGVAEALFNHADLGKRFVYTMRGRRGKFPGKAKSLDEVLVAKLLERGIVATYVSLKDWFA